LYWGNRKNKDEKVIQGEEVFNYLSSKQMIIFMIGALLFGAYLLNLGYPHVGFSGIANLILVSLIFLAIKTFVIFSLIEKSFSYPLLKALALSLLFLIFSVIIYIAIHDFGGYWDKYSTRSFSARIMFHFLFIGISTLIESASLYALFSKVSKKKIVVYLLLANLLYAELILIWIPSFF
jgi:hypothetical protein